MPEKRFQKTSEPLYDWRNECKEKEDKSTYFPVYPNLSDPKQLNGGRQRDERTKTERETERKKQTN